MPGSSILGGCGAIDDDVFGPPRYLFECGMLRLESIKLFVEAVSQPDDLDAYAKVAINDPELGNSCMALDFVRFGRVDEAIEILLETSIFVSCLREIWLPSPKGLWEHSGFGQLLRRDWIVDYPEAFRWPEGCLRNDEQVSDN